MKKIVLLSVLILLVVVIGMYAFSSNADSQTAKVYSESKADSTISDSNLIVYYFHTNFRCISCRNIEKYTKEALEKFFFDDIASGKIDFKVVNTEEPLNKHFVQDYQLYTKSVVLSKISDGKEIKFKNLDKVWSHLRNKNKLYEYIKEEINNFIN